MPRIKIILLCLALLLAYLTLWPTDVKPVAWQAPKDRGYVDGFAPNRLLSDIKRIDISPHQGPEDFAIDKAGRIYTGTENGSILRLSSGHSAQSPVQSLHLSTSQSANQSTNQSKVENWLNTGGRPLGMAFDQQDNLIVADAHLGLLSINPQGKQQILTNDYNGSPLGFVDDVDIAPDGRIFFSDASSKFSPGGKFNVMQASLLDIMEHGGHGRVLVYHPAEKSTQLLAEGLNFANGIAVSFDHQWLLVNETAAYRVLKIGIADHNFGKVDILTDNLPGFPDNISRGKEGRYWLGFVAPRDALLDNMSHLPLLRKIVQRLPTFLHPKPQRYGHVIAINDQGVLLHSLQDATGGYASTTGATQADGYLYLSSVGETAIGLIEWP